MDFDYFLFWFWNTRLGRLLSKRGAATRPGKRRKWSRNDYHEAITKYLTSKPGCYNYQDEDNEKASTSKAQPQQTRGGIFRVKWLRITVIIIWAIFCLLLLLSFCFDFFSVFFSNQIVKSFPGNTFAYYVAGYASNLGFINLIIDLWALFALYFLKQTWKARTESVALNLNPWYIVLAVAIVFGRPSIFWTQILLALIPNSWWILWPIKFGILPPLVLIFSGITNLLALYFAFTASVLALVVIPLKIFEAAFRVSNSLFIVRAQKAAFFGTLVSFWYWFAGLTLPTREEEPDDSRGARFAAPKEVQALRSKSGMAFGHREGKPLFIENEKHALIMASTRSGKGVSLIIPHLLRYPGSAFVLDPKGENANATGRQRTKLNSKVHYLDPFGLSGMPKARFNPLSRMTPENMEAESKSLASALIISQQRDHWTASAQQLLAAFILHVYTSPNIPKSKKDLGTVRRLLLGEVLPTLQEMLESEAGDGLLSSLAASFIHTPEKEFGSIVSTAQRETEILDNPRIVACIAASGPGEEVSFKDWHTDTMTVYLCLSAPKFPVFNRWLRLVLTSSLDEMTDTLDPPALPVCFMLDELATLGHLKVVEDAVGLSAGYGIQLISIFQDIAQMKDLYKNRWASFIGNAGVKALFNLDDYDTAQYWSRFLGGHLVETTSVSQTNEGLSRGQTKGETIRPLLSPEEIMLKFAKKEMLVLPQGSRPIISQRVAYFDDPTLSGLWKDPRRRKEAVQSKNTAK